MFEQQGSEFSKCKNNGKILVNIDYFPHFLTKTVFTHLYHMRVNITSHESGVVSATTRHQEAGRTLVGNHGLL